MRIQKPAGPSKSMRSLAVVGPAVGLAVALLAASCSANTAQSVTVTPAALVAESAHTTLAQKTADVTLTGSVTAAGHQIPVRGTGAVDFLTQALSLDLSTTISGTSIHLKELLVSGQAYMSGTFGGSSFSALTGKDWVSLPVASTDQNLFNSDPFAQLKVLEQEGASVTPLPSKTLGGRTVTGYSIVPTKESVVKAADSELSQLGLDQSQISQAESVIQQAQPPTIVAWFDSSHLLRQMSMSLNMGAAGAGASVGMVMNVVRYGVPVHVTAPPSSDVVSLKQFLQDAQQAGSSSN